MKDDVDALRFSLAGDTNPFIVVGAPFGGGGYIALNLPTYSTSVFLALASGDLKTIALILANLEDYEREHGVSLAQGEAVVLPQEPEVISPYAVLLLPTAILSEVANVPDCETIAGRHTSFLLAVPLTKDEYAFRRQHGHDSLMERFEADNKNIAL